MPIINLKKYDYFGYKKATFVEVSDELAEAFKELHRIEDRQRHKIAYYKAHFSLDKYDGLENYVLALAQPSPEDIMMEQYEEKYHLLMLARLEQAISALPSAQERRIRARYLEGKRAVDIAEEEGVSNTRIHQSLRNGLNGIQKYFQKRGWTQWLE